ncbi:transcriptional regulator [Fructobacillus ficulneus]|uniref:Transcriptional regulator n=2 Tax=Fructobacillus ficulneus TaxID=157463 RepID=A0A0K8MI54_9LACO|nr:transcriptional regulator [Fructobacillus ficulneus]
MSDAFRTTVQKKLSNGDFDCTKEFTVSMFSGKHKLMILWILINDGDQGFAALMNKLNGVSKKVLSNQLKELIDDQIVNKSETITGNTKRTAYSLTEIGLTLVPIINMLNDWGKDRLAQVEITQKFNQVNQ